MIMKNQKREATKILPTETFIRQQSEATGRAQCFGQQTDTPR